MTPFSRPSIPETELILNADDPLVQLLCPGHETG